ncbi:MAG: NTP transferase domain-containing protein [Coriobacteriia bacterium]|nr:NTP transferase domain-containing protein [Coriobacteriia bacterium]
MKAVIMAGGEGTRLRPLTSLRPKPMVPIVNQPVMEHILGLVKHHGITDVVATLAFMPRVIQDYFGQGEEWGVDISYAVEESPLGTAGSVKNAHALLEGEEPFLVISGDAMTDIDLTEVIAFHKAKGAAVTIALKRVDDPLDFGVVVTDGDGLIERFLEKPTWGQVFSDTINTGIYVVESWVLDYIPEGEPYDFSSELFPKLMAEGHKLYGIAVDGYWCDVGSRESYVEVHRDILAGKAHIHVPGVHASEGLWVAESAKIEENVTLGEGVVIGENVRVRAGARIGDFTVIGDNCVIGTDCRVTHSVLWSDTFVGRGATIEGAVLCRHVDVRARASIDMGAVVGDESVIGRDSRVGTGVQIFPYKRIEPYATVNSSLIWESTGVRSLFGDAGIQGLVGVDITPELGIKAAEAFGSLLPVGGHVVVTRDTTRAARMIKRAMVAGLNAAGINVRDLRVASPAVSRFTTQKTRCVGGIHVSGSMREPQSLEIRFFDSNGLDIAPWEQKKIERLYFREEFRRAFFDEVGEILYPPRPLEYYSAALKEAIADFDLGTEWRKVVADMAGGTASFILPQVAHGWHMNLIAVNGVVDSEATSAPSEKPTEEGLVELARAVELFGADMGVVFDWGAERIRLLTHEGRLLDGDTALHAVIDLWCRTRDGEPGHIAVPLAASQVVDAIAARYGREVIRPGRSRRPLAAAVLEGDAAFAGSMSGGFIFGDFFPAYDGVLATGMVSRMLAKTGMSLADVVASLPEFHKAEQTVLCPVDRKGTVMRIVTERASGMDADLSEGVRVHYSDGWALVLPDQSEPSVTVWAEGASDDVAVARVQQWTRLVEDAISAP